jgi:GT2 family glycosyltransferase
MPTLVSGSLPKCANYDADIIILTINRLAETREAVKSALSQTGVKTHIILLDQGPHSANAVNLRDLITAHDNICLFTSNINLGVGGGRNFLSSAGHGRIIVALDNDATFASEHVVLNALRIFEEHDRLGAIGFNISRADGRLDDSSWGYPAALKALSDGRFKTTTFVGAGYAILRRAWRDGGGYDPNLFFTWEEYDFCLRAINAGWHILYDGSLRVFHMVAAEERVQWSAGRTKLFVRNRLVIGRKWRAHWLSLLPRMIAYLINGALNSQFSATLQGIYDAFNLDQTLQKKSMTKDMQNYILAHEQRHRRWGFIRIRKNPSKTQASP